MERSLKAMSKVKVTLAQITCPLHDKEANLKRMREIVRKTKGKIVIFPELNLGQVAREFDRHTSAPVIQVPKIGGDLHSPSELKHLLKEGS